MDKMSKTAKILDRILAVIFWAIVVGSVLALIGMCVLAVLQGSFPGRSEWPVTALELGNLELTLHPDAVPQNYGRFLLAAGVLLLVHVPVFCIMLRTVRNTLKPFIERQPFHDTVSRNLRRLAVLVVVLVVLNILGEAVMSWMTVSIFDLSALLRTENVLHVSVNTTADLTPLLFAGVLYLLSKVFQYGNELQTLSDETL